MNSDNVSFQANHCVVLSQADGIVSIHKSLRWGGVVENKVVSLVIALGINKALTNKL
jgi:hypothetical protein